MAKFTKESSQSQVHPVSEIFEGHPEQETEMLDSIYWKLHAKNLVKLQHQDIWKDILCIMAATGGLVEGFGITGHGILK